MRWKHNVQMNSVQWFAAFSLIELMVVVAIIGILASVAVPAYDGYIVRSKIARVLSIAADAKTAISEYRIMQGNFPVTANGSTVYTAPRDNYVSSLIYPASCSGAQTGFAFYIKSNNIITNNNPTIVFSAAWVEATETTSASLTWSCGIYFPSMNVPSRYYEGAGCNKLSVSPTDPPPCS